MLFVIYCYWERYTAAFMYTQQTQVLLTFDADEHELVERQRAIVGHNLGRLDTAQIDFAEVLFAGQTCQGHISQVCF